MPRAHYLHETVRLARNAASLDYMAAVLANGTPRPDDDDGPEMPGGVRLLGTFYTAAATGPWPEVVNIWECPGGITGAWRSMLGIYHGLRPEIFWTTMEDVRLGGEGIAFGATDGCPTLDQLVASNIKARLVVQHLATVRPGMARAYVDAIRNEWLPVVDDYHHELIGLYTGTYRHDQVCLLLATDEDWRVALQAAADRALGHDEPVAPDARIPAWWNRARQFLAGDWHEELLIPFPGSPLAAP